MRSFPTVMPAKAGTQANRTVLPCVYILASKRTLYIGVTSDPVRRIWQHKAKETAGFTARYGVQLLVYLEMHDTMEAASRREKLVKRWCRAWKLALIERTNPTWRDLLPELLGCSPGSPLSRG